MQLFNNDVSERMTFTCVYLGKFASKKNPGEWYVTLANPGFLDRDGKRGSDSFRVVTDVELPNPGEVAVFGLRLVKPQFATSKYDRIYYCDSCTFLR